MGAKDASDVAPRERFPDARASSAISYSVSNASRRRENMKRSWFAPPNLMQCVADGFQFMQSFNGVATRLDFVLLELVE